MIEPEPHKHLLTRIPDSDTITLTGKLSGWYQRALDIHGHVLYLKDVTICTATGKQEVLEDWWEYNDSGQIIYNKDSDGLERWYAYGATGEETGYRDSTGTAAGTFSQEEKKPSTIEQRLEDIESSLEHLSDQTKLIIKAMYAEYKLGDHN